MGYQYGIGICRETLLHLSAEDSFEDRLVRAFSEIDVIADPDVSRAHRKQIKDLDSEMKRKHHARTSDDSG